MFDVQTLIISLLIVEGLLAVLMLLTAKVQKNYPGFTIWSISLLSIALSSLFLFLRGIIPDILSILLTNLLLSLGLLLMAESLHRFFTNTHLNRGYYLILIPEAVLLVYYALIEDSITMRSLVVSGSSVLLIILIIQIIRKNAPDGNTPSFYLISALSVFAFVMALRGTEWILHPAGRSLFEVTVVNVGLYVMAIITGLTITFMYILLNFHRLADELKESHSTTNRLLADLEGRNRDLEQVTFSLRNLNHELDQKVQERTKRIENLMLQKDHFITQIAHDLRTPLTPLVGMIPLLREGVRDDESVKLLDILIKNVNNMRHITEQLVKLASINSQSSITDFFEMNLLGLILDAINTNSVSIKNKGITLEVVVPADLTVCVSKIYGITIFSNIISNAVKYNVRSGKIIVTAVEDGMMVSVSITDTGIGMSGETIENIWDELYVCDKSRSDPESKGLGLSMVRKIVSLHGGDISVSSPGPGDGSVFTIRLQRFCSY